MPSGSVDSETIFTLILNKYPKMWEAHNRAHHGPHSQGGRDYAQYLLQGETFMSHPEGKNYIKVKPSTYKLRDGYTLRYVQSCLREPERADRKTVCGKPWLIGCLPMSFIHRARAMAAA